MDKTNKIIKALEEYRDSFVPGQNLSDEQAFRVADNAIAIVRKVCKE